MSGLEAVKKIVETEGQARRIVEEAKAKSLQIIARARDEAEMMRQESISSAQQRREQILKDARQHAEEEAHQSDLETEKLLSDYRRLSQQRKDDAVAKAVELVLNS